MERGSVLLISHWWVRDAPESPSLLTDLLATRRTEILTTRGLNDVRHTKWTCVQTEKKIIILYVLQHIYIFFFSCKLKRQRGKTVIYGAVELSSMSSVLCRQRTLCAFLPNSQIIRKILIKSTEGFQQQTEALFMWSLLIFIEIKVNKSRWPRDLTVGMHPLDFWDHGFESRWVHICSYLVFVVCCVGSGLCDELIPHSGNIPRCVCVCLTNCVWTGNLNNEPVLAPVELLRHRKERKSLRLNSSL